MITAKPHTTQASPRSRPSRPASFTRRHFLKTVLAGGMASAAWPPQRAAAARSPRFSPNAKLNHACIGVGGMGYVDLQNFLQHPKVQIVALCDVDARPLHNASRTVPDAKCYADWRELLEKEGPRIDSINVSVPDHMHFAIAYSAVLRGKHVYCQKPLCHDVAEVRVLTQTAIKQRVVTQLGTQGASGKGDRQAVQLLRMGIVGKIRHVYLCSNRPGAIETYRLPGPRPAGGEPPPAELNWDWWVGTAPMRPFVKDIYHPVKWRAWQDFGTGWAGDIGCHIFDAVWKGLGLQAPLSVVAEVQESWRRSPARRGDTWPQSEHITWTFPGNDKTEGNHLVVEWFDGEFFPPEWVRKLYSEDLAEYPAESAMLIGSEGAMLIHHGRSPILLPEQKFKDFRLPEVPPRNHYHHFVDACLGGERTESHFAQSGPMTEAVLLGTVAIRLPGEPLRWNAKAMKIPNSPHAQRLLQRQYREGWQVARF